MLRKILRWLGGALLTLLVLGLAVYIATGAQPPDADSGSASWLEPGPYAIGERDFVFVDESRPTAANRDAPGLPQRTLRATLWYPLDLDQPLPLIVHNHGLLSNRREMTYLTEALASNGYVVAAADFPLSSGSAPGGATAADVGNQPGDVSFLIDSVLALRGDDQPFQGSIDRSRIGLSGLSLGGLTTILATYHPRWRDPRVRAAAAIAGPSNSFTGDFYRNSDAPFLMIGGTADALIDFESNAAVILRRNPNGALVSIEGGSHVGFVGLADPFARFMHNPDSFGCQGVLSTLDEGQEASTFMDLGTAAEGVLVDATAPAVCSKLPPAAAIHPGRQQMITEIAVLAFFESVFGETENDRSAAIDQLRVSLAADFQEASYQD